MNINISRTIRLFQATFKASLRRDLRTTFMPPKVADITVGVQHRWVSDAPRSCPHGRMWEAGEALPPLPTLPRSIKITGSITRAHCDPFVHARTHSLEHGALGASKRSAR